MHARHQLPPPPLLLLSMHSSARCRARKPERFRTIRGQ
jgi:hypothetical protein